MVDQSTAPASPPTNAEQAAVDAAVSGGLHEAYREAKTTEEIVEIIRLAGPSSPEQAPEILRSAVTHAQPAVRLAAVEAAFQSFEQLRLSDVMLSGLADPEAGVRASTLSYAAMMEAPGRQALYADALKGDYPAEVKKECIQGLARIGTKEACDLVLSGAETLDPALQDEAAATLSLIVFQAPRTYAELRPWWAANRQRFDDLLSMVQQ